MSLGESPCRSGSAHQTIGGVCAGRRFPGKHALFLISLTVLRLRAGRLRGHPPPRVLAAFQYCTHVAIENCTLGALT